MFRNALQPWHLVTVGLVIAVVFGSKKLPDTARALGKSLRILKSEARAMRAEDAASTQGAPSTEADAPTPPATHALPAEPRGADATPTPPPGEAAPAGDRGRQGLAPSKP
ncbi:Sec-independent protein translocase subunit TatA [Streptomyces buecherae]|uniref:Sec-independent protein translocase subunit TatA n=1 Tax=Streptomyces buecherae TaxID=2763006 RepID=UPI0033E1AEA7